MQLSGGAEDRGQGHGSDPLLEEEFRGHRAWGPREIADSGRSMHPCKENSWKAKGEDRGVSRGFCEAWVEAESGRAARVRRRASKKKAR